ncbi:MAG: hypothetical protein U0414_31805 [Polyangiaceae bacterium]
MQPEHISDVLPRALSGATKGTSIVPSNEVSTSDTNPSSPLKHRNPRSLKDLIEAFEERESYDNPDVVVPTKELKMNPEGYVEVPGQGAFVLNEWSQSQLSSRLGCSWSKYWENASGTQRADEMNQRFARGMGSLRLRTRQFFPGEDTDTPGAKAVLTALLTPSYTAVPDSAVATKVAVALGRSDDVEVARLSVTPMTTVFWLKLGDAYDKADTHAVVGAVFGNLAVRNGSTGYCALSIQLALMRLACLNGMCLPADSLVLRRAHRGLDLTDIDEKLKLGLENVGPRLHQGTRALIASLKHRVPNIEEELTQVLHKARLPKRFLQPALAAYAREKHASAFGISQALTLLAQSVSAEDRFELERAAGNYLRQFAPS